MALYEKLSSSSSPEEIAAAYKEFTGLAGGETADVQKQAVDYLTGLGIAAPAITQAYDIYKAPPTGGLPTNDTVVDDGFVDTSTSSGNTGSLTQSSANLTSTNAGALDQASSASTATVSPYDAINKAFIGGDYAGTAGLVKSAGLTPDQIRAYYGFGDQTMDFLKGQGIFGTPTSTVASTLNNGADTTSGLSALNNTVSTTGSTADSTTGATTGATTGTTKTYTQTEVNQALADALSTDPNANRNDVIAAAAALGITADQVNTAYNNLSNISNSGYVKPTSGLSGVSGQKVIEGDDIETQIAQLPTEYASWGTSSIPGYIDFIRKSDGAVLDRRQNNTYSDLDLLKIGLSFIPGAGTILAVINTADAVRSGNLLQAAVGVTGLLPGMENVNTALRVGQAVDQNNPLGAISALAGNADLQKYFGTNNLTIGGYTAKDAVSAANLYTASQNGNLAGVISSAGSLINSPDTVLAGKALAVMQAAESGNPNALRLAISAFNSAGGGSSTTTGTTKLDDSVPLTDEEIADLNPDQLRVYQQGGVSGLRDYNRAIKNLTSLTTSGLTGSSMGSDDTTTGTTIGGLTGTTRSLTGALTTGTTTDQFEDLLITSLRGQGLNNSQISTYLENLNNQSSGLSDVGLLAFRQSKLSGATDAEALAAANLASGKTTVETDTGTEAEIVVTDTDFETSIYSFYETQSEFETETQIIVTSGRDTGQATELETETEVITEVVVTTASETQIETESETLTEIIVTTSSETVSETETITEVIVTTASETESETETITEIVVTTASETETETETITEIIVTTSSETETDTLTEIIITDTLTETETITETETESETITEIIVTTSSETESDTETKTETESETITEIIITDTRTESETETETITRIYTQPPPTKPPTTTSSFLAGPAALGGRGKPNEFLKENLLKTYMNKQSFKDPLAEFNKARTEMMKDNMMQQGVDPRLAAILAAKMNGEEAPQAPTYSYGEEPSSIDDILGLKGEGDQNFAQGGYVQPLMAEGGMALPLLAAKGGLPTMHKGREDFRDGKHVAGKGDGQSDDIPAMLADGEFVFPADVVSALGNGSTKAGTDKLYEMMHSIRDRARSKGRKDLPPPALKSPLDYLKKR